MSRCHWFGEIIQYQKYTICHCSSVDAETWNWNYIFVTDLMRHVLIMFDTRVTHTQRWGSWPASWKGSESLYIVTTLFILEFPYPYHPTHPLQFCMVSHC